MKLFMKPRIQKKYITFFTIVPLLMVTALIKFDCPVCDGRGFILGTPAMEDVKIVNTSSEEKSFETDNCSMSILYNYDVVLSVENRGTEDARGWVKMVLVDFEQGKTMAVQYVVVEVPEQQALDLSFNIWFMVGATEPQRYEVKAMILDGQVPCVVCGGTGKVPLNSWLMDNALKNTFQELGRETRPFFVPPMQFVYPDDYE